MFLVTLAIGIPLGRYMARVYAGEKTILDFLAPIERFFYRISGIDPTKEMNWKERIKTRTCCPTRLSTQPFRF